MFWPSIGVVKVPQDWTAALRCAVEFSGGTLLSQLNQLEATILEKIAMPHKLNPRHKPIFKSFNGKQIICVCGQVHCEAALVALICSTLGATYGLDVHLDICLSSLSDDLHRKQTVLMWRCPNFVAPSVGIFWMHFGKTDLVSEDIIPL